MRSRATIFVGNGFDRALGLRSSFEEFVEKYLTIESSDPAIRWLKKKMQDDKTFQRSTWADAEMDFAQLDFSSFCGPDSAVQTARICVDDFKNELKIHLRGEDRRFSDYVESSLDGKAREACFKRLSKHCLGLLKKWSLLDEEMPRRLTLDFVTLNYTHTIEHLFSGVSSVRLMVRGCSCIVSPGRVLHVHGELGDDKNFELFGVDHPDQISDAAVKQFAEKTGYFLKPRMDELTGNNQISMSYGLMKKSAWIWLFGVSLGRSDYSWWQRCLRLLLNSRACSMIFYFDYIGALDIDPCEIEQRDRAVMFEDFFEPNWSLDTPIYDSDKFSDVEDRIITDTGIDPLGLANIRMKG